MTDASVASIPILNHLHTLHHPSGTTRSWSSRPHPSPRTPLLATACSDRSVQIWDLRDFKLVSTIAGGHKRSIRCVGWKDWGLHNTQNGSGDGPQTQDKPVTLATGSFDANTGVWIYDPSGKDTDNNEANELDMTNSLDDEAEEDWHFTTLLTGPDSEIKDLEFSPPHYGANLLATCSRDKSVWIWEEVDADNEWETIAVLGEHTGDVKCVAWCSGARAMVDDKQTTIGCREILASGSYDDTIRLWKDVEEEGDWMCVGVIIGHAGTVWHLCWEGHFNKKLWKEEINVTEWESRIVSCSDDMSVRIWRRELTDSEKQKKREKLQNGESDAPRPERLPSIIRPPSTMETWVEEAKLPEVHVRSVYAVDWSRRTGLVVSCGGDGTLAVYREVADNGADVVMNGTEDHVSEDSGRKRTKWIVVALIEAAHEEYEINHVCWSLRKDKDKRWDDEEVIITTGDEGDVRIWTLPDEVIDDRWKAQ